MNAKLHQWLDGGKRSSAVIPTVVELLQEFHCSRVYDTGCGNGELLVQCVHSNAFDLMIGCDIEPGHVEVSRQRLEGCCTLYVADATTFRPTRDGHLDAVVALGWLHNFWPTKHSVGRFAIPFNPAYLYNAIDTFHALLRPGGVLIWDYPRPGDHPEGIAMTMHEIVTSKFPSITARDFKVCVAKKEIDP